MSSLATTWIGKTLEDGRFLIGEQLGEGGMAVVYRAEDLSQRMPVVVKVPKQQMLEDTKFLERFAAENRAMMELRHANIVSVLHVGEQEGWPFTVLQYLSGGDLDHLYTSVTGPELAEAICQWVPRVAEALDFIHKSGYVHRDVKPGNVLLDGAKRAFLGDFGIVKTLSQDSGETAHLTGTGMVLGTPDYMAPELIMGSDFDGRVDQYALGVMVFEWLAGRVPFQAPAPAGVLVKQTTVKAPSVTKYNPSVPERLAKTVMKALAKKPENRFESCGQFSEYLLKAIEKWEPKSIEKPVPKKSNETKSTPQGHTRAMTSEKAPIAAQTSEETPPKEASPKRKKSAPKKSSSAKPEPKKSSARTSAPLIDTSRDSAPKESSKPTDSKRDLRLPIGIGIGTSIVCLLGIIFFGPSKPDGSGKSPETKQVADVSQVATPQEQPSSTKTPSSSTETPLQPEEEFPVRPPVEPIQLPTRSLSLETFADEDAPNAGDVRDDNGLKMKLCYCPPGSFTMGSAADQPQHRGNEGPEDVLLTEGFWLGQTEVTQSEWQQIMGTTPWQGKGGATQGEDLPATYITWDDAISFCEKWTEQERAAGRISESWKYAIPTEAQWEYACRAGTETWFSFGDSAEQLTDHGWFQAEDSKSSQLQQVATKTANPWNLHDLYGNVSEWCIDSYIEQLPGGVDPAVMIPSPFRVHRGGSFETPTDQLGSARRDGAAFDLPSRTIGFRIALIPVNSP